MAANDQERLMGARESRIWTHFNVSTRKQKEGKCAQFNEICPLAENCQMSLVRPEMR